MLSIAYICRVSNLINFYYETSVHLHFVRFMCCGAYAQSTMTSPPPAGVKMKALKAAEARITGRPGLLQKLQKQQMAAKSVRSDDGKLYAGLRAWAGPCAWPP